MEGKSENVSVIKGKGDSLRCHYRVPQQITMKNVSSNAEERDRSFIENSKAYE